MSQSEETPSTLAESPQNNNPSPGVTRRKFLSNSAVAVATPAISAMSSAFAQPASAPQAISDGPATRPNIVIYHSDQFRSDFICAAGHNPMDFTPNLDSIYRKGTVFQNFITNQPLCAPARACLWTGQYATANGVWKNNAPINPGIDSLASEVTKVGYTANYIGKWHLSPKGPAVPAQYRLGFTGLWQAANAPEISTQPYSGEFWDNDDKPLKYDNTYRVDFLTGLAQDFLKQKHDKPFLLVLSQLEPHQQNGEGFVPPNGFEKKFRNPYAPPDLTMFPGDWQNELANYYGDCKAIDDSVGQILATLKEQNLEDNTIVIFMSDHACHFRTRNTEYKRSPHESSIHVPLMVQGPGFNNNRVISELVSMIDVAPSLLSLLGLPVPKAMQGRNFLTLLGNPAAREEWRNEVLVQISESELARALRTDEWTYVALSPQSNPGKDSSSSHYQDYQLYNNRSDPAQLVNLAGRISTQHYLGDRTIRDITAHLRQRLIALMVEAGEQAPQIDEWRYYP